MDFGLFQFHDDMFDKSDNRCIPSMEKEQSIIFKPRIRKWFKPGSRMPSTNDNLGMIAKFRGDLAYAQSKYEEAIINYKIFQENIKDVNNLLWRASEEDIGRCHLKLNNLKAALACASNLESTASNIDQFTCSSSFMIDIYDVLESHSCKLIYLKKLLLIHPCHSVAWLKLAQCFKALADENAVTCFCISYLLEKKRSGYSFVHSTSVDLMDKAMSNIKRTLKDVDSINEYLEAVKIRYASLMDGEKHSLTSIEHWSDSYIEILKEASLVEREFDKKWLHQIVIC